MHSNRIDLPALRSGSLEAYVVSAGPLDIGPPEKVFSEVPKENALADEPPISSSANGNIVVEQNVLLIKNGARTAIFETGTGTSLDPERRDPLHTSLLESGFRLDEIDAVLPTHAHLDHIGGIMREDGHRNFPNATIHLHASDVEFWLADERLGTRAERSAMVARRNLNPNLDRLVLHRHEQETFPGVTVFHTPGHTVGHTSYLISSGSDALFVVGDLVHHPSQLEFPRMRMLFDTSPLEGVDTRLRVLRYLASRSIPAFFYHFPYPGIGHVEASGDGYRFVPPNRS